ncbi:MAG TPA: hypothetical protein VGM80_13340 [Gaiellaceae bacterium]
METSTAAAGRVPLRSTAWVLSALVAGSACFLGYAVHTQKLFDTCHGGASSGYTTAALAGLVLGLIGLVSAIRTNRWLVALAAFAGVYLVVLVVLWHLAPSFWGPMTCIPWED